MKALSLWQPWASLVACGAKTFETRGWATKYRGPLVIHAAKRKVDPGDGWPLTATIKELPEMIDGGLHALPLGAALCLVTLVHCSPADDPCLFDDILCDGHKDRERAFGDFTPGRFAWHLRNVRPLRQPIPMKGEQGLFDVFPDVRRAIEVQLAGIGGVR